jgi:hypothetical protein
VKIVSRRVEESGKKRVAMDADVLISCLWLDHLVKILTLCRKCHRPIAGI